MPDPIDKQSTSQIRRGKQRARAMLEANDFDGIADWAKNGNGVRRVLISCLFDETELICFRAAEALGVVCAIEAGRGLNKVRRVIRHLLWLMNDESGGVCWYAPEAIGEILVNVPKLRDKFIPILCSFIQEEPFEQGVHRAMYRMSKLDPDMLPDMPVELIESLDDPDPVIRGCACEIVGTLQIYAAEDKVKSLLYDNTEYKLYDFESREFVHKSVGSAATDALVALTKNE